MAKYISTKQIEIDSIPGSLQQVALDPARKVELSSIEWTADKFTERSFTSYNPLAWEFSSPRLCWININGTKNKSAKDTIEAIGRHHRIHPLTIEDIVTTDHAPKYEDNLGEANLRYGFIIVKMLRIGGSSNGKILTEQLNIVFTKEYVITVQETEGDVFNSVRDRLRRNLGRIRRMGTDYLVFSLLDAIIDHYIFTVEKLGERVEAFEDEILRYRDQQSILFFVRQMKRDFIDLRRFTRPVIGIIEQMMKSEQGIIAKDCYPFYQDLRDHIRLVRDAVDGYREMLSDQLGLYTALQGNRMNEIMKVLAIISALFIPLTLISGIYGMNFQNMPELAVPWAYPLVLAGMVAVAICMGLFFRWKGWIGKKGRKKNRHHEQRNI